MWTRRDVMTGGVLAAASSPGLTAAGAPAAGSLGDGAAQTVSGQDVNRIASNTSAMVAAMQQVQRQASPATFTPTVARVRDQIEQFLRAAGKFPDYCEVGMRVFQDVYDWHIRFQQPLVSGRAPDGRYALVFQYTQLILRPETDPTHVGLPYDQR